MLHKHDRHVFSQAGQSNSEESGVDPGQLDISDDDLDIDNLDYEVSLFETSEHIARQ